MSAVEEVLRQAKTIAVVGLSPNPHRPSHEVAHYLQGQGYRIVPVNPMISRVLGERSYPSLTQVPEPVDIVDIFRRPEEVGPVVEEAVAKRAGLVWMQLGIVNEEAARRAQEAGLLVVMDRCLMVEHRRLRAEGHLDL